MLHSVPSCSPPAWQKLLTRAVGLGPGLPAARCRSGESQHHAGASLLPRDGARSLLPAAERPLESVVPPAPSAGAGPGTKGVVQTHPNTGLQHYRVPQPPQSPPAVTRGTAAHAMAAGGTGLSTRELWAARTGPAHPPLRSAIALQRLTAVLEIKATTRGLGPADAGGFVPLGRNAEQDAAPAHDPMGATRLPSPPVLSTTSSGESSTQPHTSNHLVLGQTGAWGHLRPQIYLFSTQNRLFF